MTGDTVFGSIVCGTDFTACSAAALGQAIRIAGWSGAALHVVHVIETVVIVEIEKALAPQQKSIRQGLTRDAETAWRAFAAGVPGARNVSTSLRHLLSEFTEQRVVGSIDPPWAASAS